MSGNYHSPLTIRETEVAIKEVKDHFERALAKLFMMFFLSYYSLCLV